MRLQGARADGKLAASLGRRSQPIRSVGGPGGSVGETPTVAEVFIIESLPPADPPEGEVLRQVLAFAGKKARYEQVRSRAELDAALLHFEQSSFRYLHISCHGAADRLCLAEGDMEYREVGYALRPRLRNRRVFFSACELGNRALAQELLPESGCYSMVGPRDRISFGDAALVWASFYHLMFRADANAIKRDPLLCQLRKVAALFEVAMNFFSASRSKGIRADLIDARGRPTRS